MNMVEAKGRGGQVAFDGAFVTIYRKGVLARAAVGKGEKRIPLSSITAVQWKPAGAIVNGFIQFTVPGGNERRSKFGAQTTDALHDENSVVFTQAQQADFEKLRWAIEQAIAARFAQPQPPAFMPAPAPQGPPPGWYTDPQNPAVQRWWDGFKYTEHTQPAPPA